MGVEIEVLETELARVKLLGNVCDSYGEADAVNVYRATERALEQAIVAAKAEKAPR